MATVTTLVSAVVTGISDANGINNAGSVVGQEDTVFPYIWQPTQPNGTSGTPTRLPTLFTGGAPGSATAFSVNSQDTVVGHSEGLDANGNAVTRAVVWVNGTIQDLGTLVPTRSTRGASSATAGPSTSTTPAWSSAPPTRPRASSMRSCSTPGSG